MRIRNAVTMNPEELDILSAIWIISCNDENPIITYEGIKYRFGLPLDYDIKRLIKNRPELFRMQMPSARLEKWKDNMKKGIHIPSWILEIQNEEDRQSKIKNLTTDDVFRNQFRTWVNSSPAPIEIIKFGLEHIDRLRKANIEGQEVRQKKVTGIYVPMLSLIITSLALFSTIFFQYQNNKSQINMKIYETTFKPKQEGYTQFMRFLIEGFENARKNDFDRMDNSLDNLEIAYYKLEPFLIGESRSAIWEQFQQFRGLCYDYYSKRKPLSDSEMENYSNSFIWYKKYFRQQLDEYLFGEIGTPKITQIKNK